MYLVFSSFLIYLQKNKKINIPFKWWLLLYLDSVLINKYKLISAECELFFCRTQQRSARFSNIGIIFSCCSYEFSKKINGDLLKRCPDQIDMCLDASTEVPNFPVTLWNILSCYFQYTKLSHNPNYYYYCSAGDFCVKSNL